MSKYKENVISVQPFLILYLLFNKHCKGYNHDVEKNKTQVLKSIYASKLSSMLQEELITHAKIVSGGKNALIFTNME